MEPMNTDTRPLESLRVAVVHDWLPTYAGAERVLEQILNVVPQADVYSLFDFLPESQRAFLGGRAVRTSRFQRIPGARRLYRYLLPFAPMAVESFDLEGYDLVISSSYVVAKGCVVHPGQVHVSYVHSPIRYAWDLRHSHLAELTGLRRPLRPVLSAILHYLRLFDVVTARRVDHFVANSRHVAGRIRRYYGRSATVVYPPVATEAISLQPEKDDYYVTVARLVPYKRVDRIVEAFASMPDRRLVVIGDGPMLRRLRRDATPNVSFSGYVADDVVRASISRARAFVFAAEEDFGIAPVEAQAAGTPVIALGRGGALETVVPGITGIFFDQPTPDAIVAAVRRFEQMALDPRRIRAHAEKFGVRRFLEAFRMEIEHAWSTASRNAELADDPACF